ncbi:MAG: site-specific integrase [Euryarchaeota archaeon]|nr:site-specific integrase [Euryarchaeota archaeon]
MPTASQLRLDQFPSAAPPSSAAAPGSPRPPAADPGPRRGAEEWRRLAAAYAVTRREEGDVGATWIDRTTRYLERTPELLVKVGLPPGLRPPELSAAHLHALRDGLGWERASLAHYFSGLRPFLRWLHLPLAEDRRAWRLPSGEAAHRRWLDRDQLLRLFAAAREGERVVIALEGFNGLRRVEVRRLRVQDIDLGGHRARVCGKGRNGGKWRTIPLTAPAEAALREWMDATHVTEGHVVRRKASGIDAMLSRAARRAGLTVRVSNHDLRRTFGRLAYHSGMSLVDLRNLLGHSSVDLTAHYVGIHEEEMREGLQRFERELGLSGERPRAGPPDVPIHLLEAPHVPRVRTRSVDPKGLPEEVRDSLALGEERQGAP